MHAKALVRWRGRVSVLLHALRYVQTDMSAYTKSETAKARVRKEANTATRASTQVRNEANKPKQAGNQILDSSEHSWRRCMVAGLAGLLGALSRSFAWCSLLLGPLSYHRLLAPLSEYLLYKPLALTGTTRCNLKDIASMRA